MMLRSALVLLCAAACPAQTPKVTAKPPAGVDEALRARVQEFFQYHVTGEFRKAEALVAEDTKELFYNRNKPRYLQFVEIARIDYAENFTKATATVVVVSPEMIPGFAGGPPTIPIPSTWKIENGRWCWYLEPEAFLRTPFGSFPIATMKGGASISPGMMPGSLAPGATPPERTAPPGNAPAGMFPVGVAPAATPPVPGLPMAAPPAPPAAGAPPDPGALAAVAGAMQLGMSPAGIPGGVPPEARDLVKLDKTSVSLTSGGMEKVTFSNTAPDGRTLLMLGGIPGVEAKLDRTGLKPGESAVLTLQAAKDAKDGVLNIVIPQTAEIIAIRVSIRK